MICAVPAANATRTAPRGSRRSARVDLLPAVGEVRVLPVRCGPPPGKCFVMRRRRSGPAQGPGSRGCRRRSVATTSSASSPNVRRSAPTAARWRGRPSGAARRGCRRRGTPAARCRRTRSTNSVVAVRRARSAPATARTPRPRRRRRVVAEAVARIGGDRDRDAEPVFAASSCSRLCHSAILRA